MATRPKTVTETWLKSKLGEPGIVLRTRSERPVIKPFFLVDGHIIDGGITAAHDAVLVVLPVFISVGAIPVPGIIMSFVSETYSDTISAEGPKFFDKSIVKLSIPFSFEESDDRVSAVNKLSSISPTAINCIGERYLFGITRVPTVFGFAYFGGCGL